MMSSPAKIDPLPGSAMLTTSPQKSDQNGRVAAATTISSRRTKISTLWETVQPKSQHVSVD